MRVCVIGAGSLGSAIGGRLALADHDVTLVTRNVAHVETINASGLVLDDGAIRHVVRLTATTGYEQVAGVDLAIVLVKSYDTAAAVEDTAGIVVSDAVDAQCRRPVGRDRFAFGAPRLPHDLGGAQWIVDEQAGGADADVTEVDAARDGIEARDVEVA